MSPSRDPAIEHVGNARDDVQGVESRRKHWTKQQGDAAENSGNRYVVGECFHRHQFFAKIIIYNDPPLYFSPKIMMRG